LKKEYLKLCLILCFTLVLLSCAHQPEIPFDTNAPGFWSGLWHGFISPIAFIVSLFSDYRIYAFPNDGRWYDLGFMLGIGGFSGGIFGSARRK